MSVTHKGTDDIEHEPVDVDPFIPTGRCAVCEGVAFDERLPEDRGPDNPYRPD